MARLNISDYMQNFRFYVKETGKAPDRDQYFLKVAAAFAMVSTPETTTDIVEYRDGMSVLTKKFPTWPNFTDLTMSRGVVRGDSEFFNWMDSAMGGVAYRADLEIQHFHRVGWFINQPARSYKVLEAMPLRVKVASDLDAMSGDISLAELDLAYEGLDLIEM